MRGKFVRKYWKRHFFRLLLCFTGGIWICYGIINLMRLPLQVSLSIILGMIFGYVVWSYVNLGEMILKK